MGSRLVPPSHIQSLGNPFRCFSLFELCQTCVMSGRGILLGLATYVVCSRDRPVRAKCTTHFIAYFSTLNTRAFYNILLKGKVVKCFSLGTDGRRREVISATEFHLSARDKYTTELLWKSRFPQAAWISDSSKMNIQIKITAHLLLSGVNYGVNLLFKFCDPIENSDTCINLKYRIGNKFLLSHCTRRYDGWLVKELFQFSSLAEEADIDLFLLGFSESHFKNQAIYVEGIEFRAINNMTHEEMEQLKRGSMANVQQSPTDEGHSVTHGSRANKKILLSQW